MVYTEPGRLLHAVAWSPNDENVLVFGDLEGFVRKIDVRQPQDVLSISKLFARSIYRLKFDPKRYKIVIFTQEDFRIYREFITNLSLQTASLSGVLRWRWSQSAGHNDRVHCIPRCSSRRFCSRHCLVQQRFVNVFLGQYHSQAHNHHWQSCRRINFTVTKVY